MGLERGNILLGGALDRSAARAMLSDIDHKLMDSRIHIAKGRLTNDAAKMVQEANTVEKNITYMINIHKRYMDLNSKANKTEQDVVIAYEQALANFISATLKPSIEALNSGNKNALSNLWDGGGGAYSTTYSPVKKTAKELKKT